MLKDNRLFSANSPIGRFWYFINLIIIAALMYGAEEGINHYVIPNANPSYVIPAKWLLYFIYLAGILSFISVIHRRIYDVCGTIEAPAYKTVSTITGVTIVLYLGAAFEHFAQAEWPDIFYMLLMVWSAVFLLMVLIIGLFPGKFIETAE